MAKSFPQSESWRYCGKTLNQTSGIPSRRFGALQAHTIGRSHLMTFVRRALQQGAPLRVTYANAHNVNVAENDTGYRAALQSFDIVFPEGEGMAHAARMLGYTGHEKFHSTDFWPEMFPLFTEAGAKVFLLGSVQETLMNASERLTALGLTVCGSTDGFEGAENQTETVDRIARSGAGVLLVGMGVPKQEQWIAQNIHRLPPVCVFCVGNYFEFLAGTVPRAPRWMRALGLEWLHRMMVEPGRLWKRYVLGIPRFYRIIRRQKA